MVHHETKKRRALNNNSTVVGSWYVRHLSRLLLDSGGSRDGSILLWCCALDVGWIPIVVL